MTSDEYELPLIVADTRKQLAEMAGVNEGTISRAVYMEIHGKIKSCKYKRVEVESDWLER